MQIKRTKDTILLFTYLIIKMLLKANGEFYSECHKMSIFIYIQHSANCIKPHGIQFGNCCMWGRKF